MYHYYSVFKKVSFCIKLHLFWNCDEGLHFRTPSF